MTEPSRDHYSALEAGISAFEAALGRGERPNVTNFLPEGPRRFPTLVELVHAELEYRLKAGELARVEEYLQRYPELGEDRAVVLGLIRTECVFRLRRGPLPAAVAEYAARFPDHAPELAGLLADLTLEPAAAESLPAGAGSTVDWAGTAASSVAQTVGMPPPGPPTPPPVVRGYEMLGVLGRGGMGVVYRARHVQLNRPVALKMIRGGGDADPEIMARFLAEARAVARLRHPDIVQIYEVGEQDGQPFFSLELVEGGSLDRKLAGAPQPPRQAAELVRRLARAIHAAHRQGVVHRDLKPANVLLTLDGNPKITDFGLAKELDADAGQTRSGAVVGTPSYMAPEQARGHAKDVGPAADVWALGAILYECLTGRPAFRGPNVLETLELVCSQEPVAPSRLQPGVPRDLETIALKCLRKEPAHRYAGAEALADDLDRFLDGRPILARRTGLVERTWKWARRRPALASLSILSVLVVVLGAAVLGVRDRAREAEVRAGTEKRRTELVRAFNAGLEAPAWSGKDGEGLEVKVQRLVDHTRRLEGLLTELGSLDPDRLVRDRDRLNQRFAEALLASFSPASKAVLESDDVPPIEKGIQALAARDAARAGDVRQKLRERLSKLQLVLELQAPFNRAPAPDPRTVFPGRALKSTPGALLVPDPVRGRADPVVATSVACGGDVECEAAFAHPGWSTAGQLALVLRYRDGLTYTFALAPADAGNRRPQSFQDALRAGTPLLLTIRRGALPLRSFELSPHTVWEVAAREGSLRLWASAAGERLTCLVNRPSAGLMGRLEFDDVLGLARKDGTIALHWPPAVPLQFLRVWRRARPDVPSPLQRGDDAYARGQYGEAREQYRQQAAISRDPQVRQAARCKEGLCHLAEGKVREAAAAFQAVLDDPAEGRWKNIALCHLWAVRLGQSDTAAADRLFPNLLATGDFPGLSRMLPEYLLDLFVGLHVNSLRFGGGILPTTRHNRIRDLESAVQLEEVLQRPAGQRRLTRFYLFRACWLEGKFDKAIPIARALIEEESGQAPASTVWWFQLREEYCLVLRRRGQARRALQALDEWLYQNPGVPRPPCVPLLVERARLHVALSLLNEAEKDLEAFFRHAPAGSVAYRYWSQACLMLGLLRERRGAAVGAQESWRRGLPTADSPYHGRRGENSLLAQIHQAILISLAQDVSEAELRELIDSGFARLKRSFNPNKFNLAWGLVQRELPPDVVAEIARAMWRTPRGKKTAWQIAFQERPVRELVLEMGVLLGSQLGRRLLRRAPLSAEEEELLWQSLKTAEAAALSGQLKLSKFLLVKLAVLWQDGFGVKWEQVAPNLPVPLRQQMAYFLALRYLHHFGKRGQAARLFHAAAEGVPADSRVACLARAELLRAPTHLIAQTFALQGFAPLAGPLATLTPALVAVKLLEVGAFAAEQPRRRAR